MKITNQEIYKSGNQESVNQVNQSIKSIKSISQSSQSVNQVNQSIKSISQSKVNQSIKMIVVYPCGGSGKSVSLIALLFSPKVNQSIKSQSVNQ